MDTSISKIKEFVKGLTYDDVRKTVEFNYNDDKCQITKLDNGMYNMKLDSYLTEEDLMNIVDVMEIFVEDNY